MPPHIRPLGPATVWLREYGPTLKTDIGAALTVAFVLIPQSIAYALLAELPPEYGLYAALVPLPVHALLTTSRHVSVGPFALVSLLIAETVSAVVDPVDDQRRYIHAVLLLSLLVGLLHLVMAALRLDVIVAFLSDSVIEGFTSASAVLIAASQLKHLLGMPIARAQLPLMLADVYSRLDEVNTRTLTLGMASIFLLLAVRWLNKRLCSKVPIPEMLVLLVLTEVFFSGPTTALHSWLPPYLRESHGMLSHDLPLVGPLTKSGLPPPRLPLKYFIVGEADGSKGQWSTVQEMIGPTLVVGLFSYILTMSIAKSISIRFGYRVDPKAELTALGVANIAGAFFSSFPIAGSLSRSAVVATVAGPECTPMHGILTSVVVFVVVLYAMPLVGMLPYAVLASIVLMAVSSLVDLKKPFQLYHASPPDLGLWLVAFCTTLVGGVQLGIGLSVAASLIVLVLQSRTPKTSILANIRGTNAYVDAPDGGAAAPVAATVPEGVCVYRFAADLHFANKDHFRERLHLALGELPSPPGAPSSGARTSSAPAETPESSSPRAAPLSCGSPSDAPASTPPADGGSHSNGSLGGKGGGGRVSMEVSRLSAAGGHVSPRTPSVTPGVSPWRRASRRGGVTAAVLDFRVVGYADSSACRMLIDLHGELHEHGVIMVVSGCDAAVRTVLERSGVIRAIGADRIFDDVHEAVSYAQAARRVVMDAPEAETAAEPPPPRAQGGLLRAFLPLSLSQDRNMDRKSTGVFDRGPSKGTVHHLV